MLLNMEINNNGTNRLVVCFCFTCTVSSEWRIIYNIYTWLSDYSDLVVRLLTNGKIMGQVLYKYYRHGRFTCDESFFIQ